MSRAAGRLGLFLALAAGITGCQERLTAPAETAAHTAARSAQIVRP